MNPLVPFLSVTRGLWREGKEGAGRRARGREVPRFFLSHRGLIWYRQEACSLDLLEMWRRGCLRSY